MRFAAMIAVAALWASPTLAACYEGLGCTDTEIFTPEALSAQSCEVLWVVRNQLLHDEGFCLTDRAAVEKFGNAQCSIDNPDYLQFNRFEQTNYEAIRKAEADKSC